MTDFNLDAVGIDKQSQSFEQMHGTLQAAISFIDDETNSLVPGLWEGDAARAFQKVMLDFQERAQKQQNLLMEASGLLGQTSQQIRGQDEASSSALGGLNLPPL
ncbi:WXG100 family type VII secretion target [Nocardia camponoti]|uniref:ESAT-6-like protein n=1 Tax=Nocardia camponoti TaxID=1616106 RepID=A0A917QLV6_9NOCA|nr:WXG100 family type VII secretion target [Nocardia camponoti]GGK57224.1 hypothetical protein GCM10011591_31670 [Nocardia camponoti]